LFGALLITLRESLEAALVIGLVLGYLVRVGQRGLVKSVWTGVFLGIGASVLTAFLFQIFSGGLEGKNEQLFEGITMLAAVALITTMIFWMQRHARDLRRDLETQLNERVRAGQSLGGLSLAFLAVFREGVETVLFLQAALFSTPSVAVGLGALLGLVLALLLAFLVYRRSITLNLRRFFLWTGALLILFAAGLLAHGVHELEEAGLLAPLVEHLWDMNGILDEKGVVGSFLKALFGYNGNPSLLEFASWLTYLALSSWFYFGRQEKRAERAGSQKPEPRGA